MSSLFEQVFAELPRQGPGSEACTLRVLAAIQTNLAPAPRILDIGCGSGAATLCLAKALPAAELTALDLSESLLERLRRRLSPPESLRVKPLRADMTDLPADLSGFDLIWSEGAIYLMDLPIALTAWRDRLVGGGGLVFSHLSWLSTVPAAAARSFWNIHYPAITSADAIRASIRAAGLELLADFTLPPEAWWLNYYQPLEAALNRLPLSAEAQTLQQECLAEIELYRAHGSDYGYRFYCTRSR